MGQGVPLTDTDVDKIVRLHDEQGLDFAVIAERLGIKKPSTVKKLYDRRKANPDLRCSGAIDDPE